MGFKEALSRFDNSTWRWYILSLSVLFRILERVVSSCYIEVCICGLVRSRSVHPQISADSLDRYNHGLRDGPPLAGCLCHWHRCKLEAK